MLLALKPHPDTPCAVVKSLTVEVTRMGPSCLRLDYMLVQADLSVLHAEGRRVLYPQPADPVRGHELWLHTCFEAFVRGSGPGYREINLSLSGEWATYVFSGYREGMHVDEGVTVSDLDSAASTSGGRMRVAQVEGLPPGDWQVGLSAIVETTDGQRHFFALTHPPGEPDFHHPDAFSLDLPA